MSQNKWYQEGLKFTCTQCGNCCTGTPGYVWTTVAERKQIAEHLNLDLAEFTRRYAHRVGLKYSLNERRNGEDYDCVFLENHDGKRVCSIYPVRPRQCRTWPFWPENLRTRAAWNSAARGCPGMNRGERHDLVHIEIQRKKDF